MTKEKLMEYRDISRSVSSLELEIKTKKEEFEESIKDLRESITDHQAHLSGLKEDIKIEALQEFEESGKKKLFGGIGIQERKSLLYDVEQAFDWAKETGVCLLLDKKKFEKVGLEMTDFVTEDVSLTVTFPKEIKLEE